MTSLKLLGVLLVSGVLISVNYADPLPSLEYNERGNLLDALKFIEMKALEEEQLKDDLEEDEDNYENYIRENWPDEAPEIMLEPGPPIEEPPYYNVDEPPYYNVEKWPNMEQFQEKPAFPFTLEESEVEEDLSSEVYDESELEMEEGDLESSEMEPEIDDALEQILKDVIAEDLLTEFDEVEEVEEEMEEEGDDELELEGDAEEEVIVEDDGLDELSPEDAALLDELTKEIADEVEEEVAEEVQKMADIAVKELAEEIAEEILLELNTEGGDDEDEEEGEMVEEERDSEEDIAIPGNYYEEGDSEDEYNQITAKRDGEYPFGAWQDEANDDKDEMEDYDEDEDEGFGNEIPEGYDEEEVSEEGNELDESVNWEALQYLYGPYLDKLAGQMAESEKYGNEDEGYNDIGNALESSIEEEEEYIYPQYSDEDEAEEEQMVEGEGEEDVSEEVSDYDYSDEPQNEAENEVLYEEAVEQAIVELENEAAEAAKQLVDDMLFELVEEEREKEILEEEEQQEEQLLEEYEQECGILDYILDDCEVIDLYSGLGGDGFKEAFTGPCNRHQLCYLCGSTYEVSERSCDEMYYDEMMDMCNDYSCQQRVLYFLKAAQISRTMPAPDPYLDYVCRNECVVNALVR
ncbi:uncharacterized protein LOC144442466 [Glandiceps talaboti]